MKLIFLILMLFCPALAAGHLWVKNESEHPITGVYLYTATTFNNSLQWDIQPGEQFLVQPGYQQGVFGVYIESSYAHAEWFDFNFDGKDYCFHFKPPDDSWVESKLHRNYDTAYCTTSGLAGGGWIIPFLLVSIFYVLARRHK